MLNAVIMKEKLLTLCDDCFNIALLNILHS